MIKKLPYGLFVLALLFILLPVSVVVSWLRYGVFVIRQLVTEDTHNSV